MIGSFFFSFFISLSRGGFVNLTIICLTLNTLCLLALAFLIQRIRAREAAEVLASQEQARKQQEASVRLEQTTHALATHLKEQTKQASVANPEELTAIQGLSMALMAQACSMGVQAWQVIIPAFVAVQNSLEARRQHHRIEASTEADQHAAKIRAQAFANVIAKAEAELQILDHCPAAEEAQAVQAKVRWILSLWSNPTELELQAMDLAGQSCARRLLMRTQALREEAMELHDRQFSGTLKKLQLANSHADIADLHLNRWHHDPASPVLFGGYFGAVTAAINALPPEEATRILLEAENHLRTFKTSVRIEEIDRALEFQANLQNAKMGLQGRIRDQRHAAFSEIVASLPSLAKQSQTTQSRSKLGLIKQDADTLIANWGPMNPAERIAWEEKYAPFLNGLLDRDETLVNAEKAAEREKATNNAIQAADKLAVALAKASSAANQAKEAKDIDRVLSEVGMLVQPDLDALPKAKRESLEAGTQTFQTAIQAAEHRIIGEMRASYNQHSVKEIDSMLGRLGHLDNLKAAKTNTLAGEFAKIDPALLEPAIHQYYELAVGKVINLLDDEATRTFMDFLARAPKSGMETQHG